MVVEWWCLPALSSRGHYNCCGVGSHVSACQRVSLALNITGSFCSMSWQLWVWWEREPPGRQNNLEKFSSSSAPTTPAPAVPFVINPRKKVLGVSDLSVSVWQILPPATLQNRIYCSSTVHTQCMHYSPKYRIVDKCWPKSLCSAVQYNIHEKPRTICFGYICQVTLIYWWCHHFSSLRSVNITGKYR